MSEDIIAIKAMSQARADAFNQGDAAAIAQHFTENAYLMAPGSSKKEGPAAVAAYYQGIFDEFDTCLLYTSPSPRDVEESRMPSSA